MNSVPKLQLSAAKGASSVVPGSISPRPERKAMRNSAAEFAERGPSVSEPLNLENDYYDDDARQYDNLDTSSNSKEHGMNVAGPTSSSLDRTGSRQASSAQDITQWSRNGVFPHYDLSDQLLGIRLSSFNISGDGTLFAIGDENGRIYVGDTTLRREQAASEGEGEDGKNNNGIEEDIVDPFALATVYSPVIDPLKSCPVTAAVNSIAICDRVSPAIRILMTNEKVPKLYQVIEGRSCPQPLSALDSIGTSKVGPLTHPSTMYTIKPVASYAMEHEYRIHTIAPQAEGKHFFTVDDVEVKLWCAEYTDVPLDVLSIKPMGEEEPSDYFLSASLSSADPVLFTLTSFSGEFRVFDTRQQMKWDMNGALALRNPDRKPTFGGCLSPCGRFAAARDDTNTYLYDLRKANKLLQQWKCCENDIVYEGKIDVCFSPCGSYMFTGTDGPAFCVMNTTGKGSECTAVAEKVQVDDEVPIQFLQCVNENELVVASRNRAQFFTYR